MYIDICYVYASRNEFDILFIHVDILDVNEFSKLFISSEAMI